MYMWNWYIIFQLQIKAPRARSSLIIVGNANFKSGGHLTLNFSIRALHIFVIIIYKGFIL